MTAHHVTVMLVVAQLRVSVQDVYVTMDIPGLLTTVSHDKQLRTAYIKIQVVATFVIMDMIGMILLVRRVILQRPHQHRGCPSANLRTMFDS